MDVEDVLVDIPGQAFSSSHSTRNKLKRIVINVMWIKMVTLKMFHTRAIIKP